ncbi:unnamed protein product [Protopolystoma xenopodis]|uniref:Uncharacterized protein n=1 Tax=Protopolystoma xenopodis TaxID=117903 RepID=A0A3S5CJY1_9PLAT|nr:unnamed protein product [Protopolystoma xenopodis]
MEYSFCDLTSKMGTYMCYDDRKPSDKMACVEQNKLESKGEECKCADVKSKMEDGGVHTRRAESGNQSPQENQQSLGPEFLVL